MFGTTATAEPAANSRAARIAGLTRVNQSYRRRTDDAVEDAFRHACLMGDIEIAGDLVAALERAIARRGSGKGPERRADNQQLARMKAELAMRRDAGVDDTVS